MNQYAVGQHIGWLRMYLQTMTEKNWADMRTRCQRQLDQLQADLAPEANAPRENK